tara:strand:- start:2653 stop:4005 length:1353 start_codon:yes stop_codon:yes gene_type:complete
MKKVILYMLFSVVFGLQDTLVVVNGKVITKNDFIRRSEYTIRPNYCKSNSNIDKKIILNSLIAEKLFSIENSESQVVDEKILNSINGIKEQTMRKLLLEDYVNEKIMIDKNFIADLYNRSQFEYDVNFINISTNDISGVDLNNSFNEIAKKAKVDLNTHYITFLNCSNEQVFNYFYYDSNQINKGDLIGPIITSDDSAILIEVLKKKKNIKLNMQSQSEQYNKVRDYYIELESNKIRERFISEIMKGKKIEFEKNTFLELADYYYNHSDAVVDSNNILFTLNGEKWSIRDIMNISKSHPLVFRDSYDSKNEFYNQFKLALVDLIRDSFLSDKASEYNYENHPIVLKEVEVWMDYALAIDKRNQILHDNIELKQYDNEYKFIENVLNKESELLFEKYSDNIVIDVDMFNSIDLSRIDMMVINLNQPYQLTVPLFPKLTIKNNLNYGVKKPT